MFTNSIIYSTNSIVSPMASAVVSPRRVYTGLPVAGRVISSPVRVLNTTGLRRVFPTPVVQNRTPACACNPCTCINCNCGVVTVMNTENNNNNCCGENQTNATGPNCNCTNCNCNPCVGNCGNQAEQTTGPNCNCTNCNW